MMKKVKEYKLVDESCSTHLNIQVSNLIQSGFQPFGSLSVYVTPSGNSRFAQVMVKYEEPR